MKKELIFPALAAIFAIIFRFISYFVFAPPQASLIPHCISAALGVASVVIVYFIALKLSENNVSAFFAAILAAGIPTFSWRIANNYIHALELLLLLLIILAALNIKKLVWYLPLALVIPFAFLHINSLTLIPIILFYMLLVKLLGLNLSKPETRFYISSIVALIIMFAIFALTPTLILIISKGYYIISATKLTTIFAIVGALPIYFGLIGAYDGVTKRNKDSLLLLSTTFIFFTASASNLIALRLSLPFIAFSLACLSSLFYVNILRMLNESIVKEYINIINSAVFSVIIMISIMHWLVYI